MVLFRCLEYLCCLGTEDTDSVSTDEFLSEKRREYREDLRKTKHPRILWVEEEGPVEAIEPDTPQNHRVVTPTRKASSNGRDSPPGTRLHEVQDASETDLDNSQTNERKTEDETIGHTVLKMKFTPLPHEHPESTSSRIEPGELSEVQEFKVTEIKPHPLPCPPVALIQPHDPDDRQLPANKKRDTSPLGEAIERMEKDFLRRFPEVDQKVNTETPEEPQRPSKAHISEQPRQRTPLTRISANERKKRPAYPLNQASKVCEIKGGLPYLPDQVLDSDNPELSKALLGVSTWHAAHKTAYVHELQSAGDRVWPRVSLWREEGDLATLDRRYYSKSEPQYHEIC